ncbi:hypothetical protein [Neisseria cinerea]|uniref:Uncharacterized protein n=1 Tax=Neisseria cinerea ATCC 14685 TaxID=546262 RepID=D0W3S0_NEICI|nr:hypothetical protein NEICINOT_04311 [Neisseria cinerea ATCC 14685]
MWGKFSDTGNFDWEEAQDVVIPDLWGKFSDKFSLPKGRSLPS